MDLIKLPKNVTVICLGNICRSPVGQFLLEYYAVQSDINEINDIKFDSAGLSGGYGGMYYHSEKYLKKFNINFSNFRSKRTSIEYLNQYDLILVMEDFMITEILEEYFYENTLNGVLMTFSEAVGLNGDIEDPYGMPWNYYLEIMETINDFSQKIIENFESI